MQQHRTDSPMLPVGQMEQLHQFRPDLVDFIIQQTALESDNRRANDIAQIKENKRLNTFIFAERLVGTVLGFLIGITGVVGGAYIGLQGHDWLGGIVATATITTLAVAFLRSESKI